MGNSATVLLTLFIASTSATFLQWRLCDDSRGSGIIPYYLGAVLDGSGDGIPQRLILDLVRYQSGVSCRDTNDGQSTATVQLDGAWVQTPKNFTDEGTQFACSDFPNDKRPMPLAENSSRAQWTLLDADVGVLPALSTLRIEAHLDSLLFDETECIAAHMTPAIPQALSTSLRFVPLAILLFVLLVSALRTISAASSLPQDDDASGITPSPSPSSPVLLPIVSDCLNFLQFIFLTGGLSLSYPGFYPAAAGHLNWFALFTTVAPPLPSFVHNIPGYRTTMRNLTYNGVSDGIYEANGTYGGTVGLEVMTQMVGAPMTADTWLVMVLLIMCIVVALSVFLWALELARPGKVFGLPMISLGEGAAGSETSRWRLRFALAMRVGNGVLRLLLSYFTLPLVALSTYQINFWGAYGAGHMTLASIILVLILLGFTWLTVHLPATSLGALVFETGQWYQQVEGDTTSAYITSSEENQARRQGIFVITLFVLNIIRGLAVGGLQRWGVVQLVVLVACEVIMLAAARILRPYPMLSIGFMANVLRLMVLICFVPSAFRPSKLLGLKSIFAYTALSLYAAALVGIFFLPSCWHFYKLIRQGFWAPTDVSPLLWHSSNLGQLILLSGVLLLTRRLSLQDISNISLRSLQPRDRAFPGRASEIHSTASSPASTNENLVRRSPGSSQDKWDPSQRVSPNNGSIRSDSPLDMNYFYRPSRSLISTVPGEASRRYDNPPPSSKSSSTSAHTSQDSGSTPDEPPESATVANEAKKTKPLGPKWNDYSFREADLFYGTPQQPTEDPDTTPPHSGSALRPPAVRSWLSSWSLRSGWNMQNRFSAPEEERGFSVVRPSRTPYNGPSVETSTQGENSQQDLLL